MQPEPEPSTPPAEPAGPADPAAPVGEALSDADFAQAVAGHLQTHGLSPQAAASQARFAVALRAANERLNLTAITDAEGMALRHVLDSLTVAPHLEDGEHVLDLGSGGGLPGIPLALLRPDLRVTLLEGKQRKAEALAGLVATLQLAPRVTAVQGRGEEWLHRNAVDVVVARAIGPLADVLTRLSPVRRSFGRLILMKGPAAAAEVLEAASRFSRLGFLPPESHALELPAGAGQRVLLITRRRR